MRRFVPAVVRWTLLLTAGLPAAGPVSAQIAPAPAAADVAPASSRQMEKRFSQGRELLEARNYAEGTRFLQSILEGDEDDFFYPDPENKAHERSLKFESQSLLGSLPAAGREMYERQYGPVARRLLAEAIANNDADQLGLVTRRFFHTQAGYEAAYRLGGDHLDHGHPLAAALCFERLRQTPQADDQFEPLLSLKTALSWQRAGRDDKAIEVLTLLKRKYRQPTVVLGGREVALFDDPGRALAWLTSSFGVGSGPDGGSGARQWTMVRGDSRRNAESSGGSPYLNRSWRASTVEGGTPSRDGDEVVTKAIQERKRPAAAPDDENSTPMVPGLQPLVVGDLVIVRGIADLRAYELSTGRLVWAASEKDRLLHDTLRTGSSQVQVPGLTALGMLIAERVWGDVTFGTLSSDGELVYSIEDLGLGNPYAFQVSRQGYYTRDYNRLVACDVRTGKMVWEVGGPRGDEPDALAGIFFLGAPLVLDRRLYTLCETGSEVRLVVLEPRSGRLLWSQALNDDKDVVWDAFRRRSGLTPSYDGGILVCPTGSNQATAVDLTARSLLWRYRLRSWAETYDLKQERIIVPQLRAADRLQANGGIDQNRWLDSTPIISDSRVLLAPRDANELHCVNLLDGSLAWKAPRGDGLFLAGVHEGKAVIVGRSLVYALRLSDGKPAWSRPATISVPSGRGFIAADRYHIPLSTAEVATIDLRDGRVVARSRSRGDRVPGNLVGLRGHVVSQGPDFVEAFRQLETLEIEIAATLAANSDDAAALAQRGQMRLERGELNEAYADLQRALALKSDDDGIRELLAGSLLEGLRVDFATYRTLPVDFDKLLTNPEQRSAYLWLQGVGLERVGDKAAAFEALLRFADLTVSDREMERIDSTLTVRRDRLVRARVAQLYAVASQRLRSQMDAAVRVEADRLRDSGSGAAVRRFLEYFGDRQDARELARGVALGAGSSNWLGDEFLLRRFDSSPDARLAAAATAGLAELLLAADRAKDAVPLLDKIEREWPDVPGFGGHSGRELVADRRKRPDVARETSLPLAWPTGEVVVQRENGSNAISRLYNIPIEGDRRPFFVDMTLEISSRFQDFIARDGLGRQVWKLALETPVQSPAMTLYRAYVRDHLLIVSLGTQVMAIDTLGTPGAPGPRLLWKMSLVDSPGLGYIIPRIPGRFRRMPFNQLSGSEMGAVGPILRNYMAVQRNTKLQALEPLTGRPLWIRDGIIPGSDLFGDDEFLFAVPPESNQLDMYRVVDGEHLGQRDLPPASQRLEFLGRTVVTWQKAEGEMALSGRDRLSARDLPTGQAAWTREFAPGSLVVLVENSEAAVLEPSGRFTIVSLADGSVSLQSAVEPVRDVQQILVLRSRQQYLLAANEPFDARVPDDPGPQNVYVHGNVHAFERATGKKAWSTRVERQGLDPYQPAGLPVLAFLCKSTEPVGTSRLHYLCLDRRTGRVIDRMEQTNESHSPIDLSADIEQHRVDLKLPRFTIRLTFTDNPWLDAAPR